MSRELWNKKTVCLWVIAEPRLISRPPGRLVSRIRVIVTPEDHPRPENTPPAWLCHHSQSITQVLSVPVYQDADVSVLVPGLLRTLSYLFPPIPRRETLRLRRAGETAAQHTGVPARSHRRPKSPHWQTSYSPSIPASRGRGGRAGSTGLSEPWERFLGTTEFRWEWF